MLLRRHIGKRLADYYAQPSHSVVGTTPRGDIKFSSLWGEWHWRRVYGRAYKEQEGQWLTPVELFRPHYSNILANFIADVWSNPEQQNDPSNLHIVELGGGRGTNANLILSHLRQNHKDIYNRVSYTIFDSSPTLHELQRVTLLDKNNSEHCDKIDLVLEDMTDIAEKKSPFLTQSDTPTITIALELLDNLPHDKVSRCVRTRALQQAEIQTDPSLSEVESTSAKLPATQTNDSLTSDEDDEHLVEVFKPLTDPLLKGILADESSYAGFRPKWVPTVACGTIKRLFETRPNSHLLIADFDYLPPPDITHTSCSRRRSVEADGEPIITSMDGLDHECYLNSPSLCDILFPTDFAKLASFVKKQQENKMGNNSDAKVMKQADFLQMYGPDEVQSTKSWITGFSPLIHDFANCSVLLVTKRKLEGAYTPYNNG